MVQCPGPLEHRNQIQVLWRWNCHILQIVKSNKAYRKTQRGTTQGLQYWCIKLWHYIGVYSSVKTKAWSSYGLICLSLLDMYLVRLPRRWGIPEVGVTKVPSVDSFVNGISYFAIVYVINFEACSYLAGVPTAKLRWYLSIMDVVLMRQLVCWWLWKNRKITEPRNST